MCKINNILKNWRGAVLFPTTLLICNLLTGQSPAQPDTIIKVSKGSLVQTSDNKSFFTRDTTINVPSSIIPAEISRQEKTITFYDSLKVKATKSKLGHKIYDLVIVSPDQPSLKSITTSSIDNFTDYKGKKIRNIEIRRLNVFGTDIKNPSFQDSSRFDKLLNSTHLNTNERVIREYLLFSTGDAISPLVLSDNERILRQLPFIDDSRIIIVPVSDNEADIIVLTKDLYSLGIDYSFKSLHKGTFKLFERNIFGIGHELEFVIPYDSHYKDSPGFGAYYKINNIGKTFSNFGLNFSNGLGRESYGASLTRDFLTSSTKYAGGISISETFTTEDLDTLPKPVPLKINYQDFWLARSVLINEESVTRVIIGVRYTNNNPFMRPEINSNSFHSFQKYKLYLGSAALSFQKFYKTNLIYNYGRTEDIPYGALFRVTAGREFNEFKVRTYLGADVSGGKSFAALGYFYVNAGYSTYIKGISTEQGLLKFRINHFSNLYNIGKFQVRNFLYLNYTHGFTRYTDEYLYLDSRNGISGFSNDSLKGTQRVTLNLESVVFSPIGFYGFRFAFFGFADMAIITQKKPIQNQNVFLSGLGIGIRIRNDNLIINTFQIKLGYFPNPPLYSNLNYFRISGEQLLRPTNFDAGPPEVFIYR
jgi:hypothetical protein